MANYSICPKCGHTPLPADQTLPASCPACGLILAKYAEIQTSARKEAKGIVIGEAPAESWEDAGWWDSVTARLLFVPPQTEASHFWVRSALLVFFAIWGIRLIGLDFRDGEMGESFLHGPLLVFHEAGHVIFRLLGEFMTILGGTLGQLLMPIILAGALLLKGRDPFGASIGLWLLGVSFLDVAPYVYDALEPKLMLLSGTTGEEGGHDWIYLLETMGILKRAHGLGSLVHKLGAAIIVISVMWGGIVLWRQYRILASQS